MSTLVKYNDMWRMFLEFALDMDMELCPLSICKYIEYLFLKGLKCNSIKVHLSAIAHGLKVRDIPDFTKTYLVTVMLRGAKNIRPMAGIRIPLDEFAVTRIIMFLERHVSDIYLCTLYCTVFSLAYHMCLRVSEYAVCPHSDHTLWNTDLHRINFPNGDNGYRVKFRSFKHCPSTFPDFLLTRSHNFIVCPVKWLNVYLAIRPKFNGPLFVDNYGPITPKLVNENLQKCVEGLGWDSSRVQSHSLRIGRATDWAKQGYSAIQIKAKGRWYSDAYLKYIKPLMVLF